MIIPKEDLKILIPCAKDKAGKNNRYSLNTVLVQPETNTLFSSNNHSLYRIHTDPFDPEDYPVGPGKEPLPTLDKDTLIPVAPLEQVARGKSHITSILNSVRVDNDAEHTTLTTTDLDTWDKKTFKSLPPDYPDVASVMKFIDEALEKDGHSVWVATAELDLLVKTLKAAKAEHVKFTIGSAEQAVKIELPDDEEKGTYGERCTGYIMPCLTD